MNIIPEETELLSRSIDPFEGDQESISNHDDSLTDPSSDIEHNEVELETVQYRLYVSHFLSTWNSRVFEFAAVLYLASIFSTTLLPMSIYALLRGMSAILFSSSIGSLIDRGDRLSVVRLSIGGLSSMTLQITN